jgi:signal transduction histidine kinase
MAASPHRAPVQGMRLQWWRAAAVFRVATLLVDGYLVARWQALYAHAAVADAVLAGMAVTTALICWLALTGRAHRWPVVTTDAVITAVLTLLTIAAQTAEQRHGTMPTLTTLWAAGPALEAGILAGWAAGVAAGLVQFAVAVAARDGSDGRTLGSAVLLVVAGGMIGYVSTLTVRAEAELAAAAAAQAALRERQRLARSVHDGVLQVLGLVHREGVGSDGRWAELGRAAGEQEVRLREFLRTPDPDAGQAALGDLATALRELGGERVTVSVPGRPVAADRRTVAELTAAVRASLDNVDRHAGDGARAWVLLDDAADAVRVTVRDDGAGFDTAQLAAAERSGRLGVASSIRGRVVDLGGTVTITSAPGRGTCVEIAVPRTAR